MESTKIHTKDFKMDTKVIAALAQSMKNKDNIAVILAFLEKLPSLLSWDQAQSDIYRKEVEELKKSLRQ